MTAPPHDKPSPDAPLPPPAPALDRVRAYSIPKPDPTLRMKLDMNEGPRPPEALAELIRQIAPNAVNTYPDQASLETKIAGRFGVEPARVVAGAGLDDILSRLCQAYAAPGRRTIVSRPTFSMIPHYLALSGCETVEIDWWSGPFPLERTLEAIDDTTALVFLVTPNNPTGLAATERDLRALSARLAEVRGMLAVDLAYTEFADRDLTRVALDLPNAAPLRTLSKAWGLAGMRVGYGVFPEQIAAELRKLGQPFPITSPSAAIAAAWLDAGRDHVRRTADRVRHERDRLAELLRGAGAEPIPKGQANFVLARFPAESHAETFAHALRTRGIAIRRYTAPDELVACVRITCPANHDDFEQLALEIKELAL